MSDNSDNNVEPILTQEEPTPEEDNTLKKPKKGKMAKLKDKFKDRGSRKSLSGGDIDALASNDEVSAKKLETLTSPSDETPEETKKKDTEKTVTDQKAFERNEQLKRDLGIDEQQKHSFYQKIEKANDKYKSSGFGKSVDRLGRNMKTVGQGAEAMTEAALLETALYNMLMLLFELLFGAKKGVKKLPEGAKWLNANRKREHLYSGALRKYAKEDHGKALKEADGLKKEIEDLKKERADLKNERKEIQDKYDPLDSAPEDVKQRFEEIDKRLKENKTELKEKQGKYDDAMLKMAKAENTFKKHGDASKNEKWQKAMNEYKELLPKLQEARDKYKADKKIVDETPLLQRDAKRAELKLDEQKAGLTNLKKKEYALYDQIKGLEKKIGKTSAELEEMQKAANKDHSPGMDKGRERAQKIAEVEDLVSQRVESMKKGEGLENTKEALLKDQKEIKEAQAELKKIPDKDKTPEEKAQKAALDKKAAEVKGKLTNLDGKKATLDNAVNKAQAKLDKFPSLPEKQRDKKLKNDPDYVKKLTDKLEAAKLNQEKYQKLGNDLTERKEKLTEKEAALDSKIKTMPEGSDAEKKSKQEAIEKHEQVKGKLDRVTKQLDAYNAESSGQIAQNKQATDNLDSKISGINQQLNKMFPPKPEANVANTADTPIISVDNPTPPRQRAQSAPVNLSQPIPIPERPQSAPVNAGGRGPIFETTVGPSNPQPMSVPRGPEVTSPPQQPQQNPIFSTKPELTPAQVLSGMIDRYAKMDHPVPPDQLMDRFKNLMHEGAAISQQNSMRDFLETSPQFRPSTTNMNDDARRQHTLEIIFAKAYLDHLKSTNPNKRELTVQEAEQVKAIAKEVANNPETTSMLKASTQQRRDAAVQALSTGAQSAKPEGEKINIPGDLANLDTNKNKGTDKKDATDKKDKRKSSSF